ncbi:MAG: alpha/beta fold hydrolase [Gemmatimonadota bacterium]
MIRQDFRLQGPHGPLRGTVRYPQGLPPRTAVVVAHGFKGFQNWGFFPRLCSELARDGHAVISFNFSGSGVGEDGETFTELDRFAANTFSQEVAELEWMIRRTHAGEVPGLPPRATARRVGLLGHSRGGGVAVLVAGSQSTPVDALVTWAAVATFHRWPPETLEAWRESGRSWVLNSRTGQQLPLDLTLLHDLEENRDALDIQAAAAQVAVPWLVVHGQADPTVLVQDAHRLIQASSLARPALIEEAGHTFNAGHPLEEVPPELAAAVEVSRDHFRRHLGPED